MKIRAEMLKLGWESDDRLSKDGFYSIWFKRWDWHGYYCGTAVTFSAHTNNLEDVDKTVEKASRICKEAWENFPDDLPCMSANGEIIPQNSYIQEAWKKYRIPKDSPAGNAFMDERGKKLDALLNAMRELQDEKELFTRHTPFDNVHEINGAISVTIEGETRIWCPPAFVAFLREKPFPVSKETITHPYWTGGPKAKYYKGEYVACGPNLTKVEEGQLVRNKDFLKVLKNETQD